jgi:hypothetical protein
MEIRMQVDDKFLRDIMSVLNVKTGADVVRESLTILSWATKERQRGRVVLSADHNGRNTVRLAMPSLEQIRERA